MIARSMMCVLVLSALAGGCVELGLIVGRPVHVRLFFLLLTTFLAGCFLAVLMSLYRSTDVKRKREPATNTESDDFFLE